MEFNKNESKVLLALFNQTMESTSGEFGYMEDVDKCGFSRHEFAGYISSLKAKKVFDYLDSSFKGQYALKENVSELFINK